MGKPEPKKRKLKFNSFDDMLVDVRSLQQDGYVHNGNWTLGQTCSHIADWMQYPMDGFPKPPFPLNIVMWIMKVTVAPGMKRKILSEGFSGGMPTAPQSVADAQEMTDENGIRKLEEAIQRLQSFDGEFHASPLFGETDTDTLKKVSLLHGEHHLGYLEPKKA